MWLFRGSHRTSSTEDPSSSTTRASAEQSFAKESPWRASQEQQAERGSAARNSVSFRDDGGGSFSHGTGSRASDHPHVLERACGVVSVGECGVRRRRGHYE